MSAKTWTIIGPLGDCEIQALTPQQAARLYPTLKGWKQSRPTECIVMVLETGQRFRVAQVAAYEATELPSNPR